MIQRLSGELGLGDGEDELGHSTARLQLSRARVSLCFSMTSSYPLTVQTYNDTVKR